MAVFLTTRERQLLAEEKEFLKKKGKQPLQDSNLEERERVLLQDLEEMRALHSELEDKRVIWWDNSPVAAFYQEFRNRVSSGFWLSQSEKQALDYREDPSSWFSSKGTAMYFHSLEGNVKSMAPLIHHLPSVFDCAIAFNLAVVLTLGDPEHSPRVDAKNLLLDWLMLQVKQANESGEVDSVSYASAERMEEEYLAFTDLVRVRLHFRVEQGKEYAKELLPAFESVRDSEPRQPYAFIQRWNEEFSRAQSKDSSTNALWNAVIFGRGDLESACFPDRR